jgi:RNase P subunit RPR2
MNLRKSSLNPRSNIKRRIRKERIIMMCEKCAWAIWYYNEVVECCNSDECPSEEEFENAEKEGRLAI